MKNKILKILSLCILFNSTAQAVSVVYNLFVVQTTAQVPGINLRPSAGGITIFNEAIKRYDGSHDTVSGELNSIFTRIGPWYVKADFAFAHLTAKNCCDNINFKKTQTDDLVFTGGYNYQLSKRTNLVFSALLGMPTHNDMSLIQPIQFGTGHVGLGVRFDTVIKYRDKHTFTSIGRYVRYFPRHTCDIFGNHFKYNIGNLIDVYFSNKTEWGHHTLEVGYDGTFDFGATICPKQPLCVAQTILKESTLVANHLFTDYTYAFLIRSHASVVTIGFAYSHDSKPPVVGHKRNIGTWVTWGINF